MPSDFFVVAVPLQCLPDGIKDFTRAPSLHSIVEEMEKFAIFISVFALKCRWQNMRIKKNFKHRRVPFELCNICISRRRWWRWVCFSLINCEIITFSAFLSTILPFFDSSVNFCLHRHQHGLALPISIKYLKILKNGKKMKNGWLIDVKL